MRNIIFLSFTALCFGATQLCWGMAVVRQAAQNQGSTHEENGSDYVQNLVPALEHRLLQLPFGKESPSQDVDVLLKTVQIKDTRTAPDDDIAISRLPSDLLEVKDTLPVQAASAETAVGKPAQDKETIGSDTTAADNERARQPERPSSLGGIGGINPIQRERFRMLPRFG